MTIQRAREILGDEIAYLTDREVEIFISDWGTICDAILKDILTKTKENVKDKREEIN